MRTPKKSGLTFNDIERVITDHIQNTGRRPSANPGLIQYGKFKDLITWHAVNRSLIRYVEKHPDCGFTALASFVDKLDKEGKLPPIHPRTGTKPPGRPATPFNIDDIATTIRETLFSGRKIALGDRVEFGDLWRGKYWRSVDYHLTAYASKNPGCGFNDIESLMKKLGIENIPEGSHLPEKRPKSAREIFQLAVAHKNISGHLPPLQTGIMRSEFHRASVMKINKDLRKGRISGLTEMFGDEAHPITLEGFFTGISLSAASKSAAPKPE